MGPAKRRKGKTLALLASYRIEPDRPDEGRTQSRRRRRLRTSAMENKREET
jgi:hypothetical protein